MSELQPVRVCFAYEHQYRVVDVTRAWVSSAGDQLITGVDPDKGEYRTFRVDRIQGKVRVVAPKTSQPQTGELPAQDRTGPDRRG